MRSALRVCCAFVLLMIGSVTAVMAQGLDPTGIVLDPSSLSALSSTSAVVSASIFLTYLAKRILANVRHAQDVPLWCYVAAFAFLLTYIANRITHTEHGTFLSLALQAVINGAIASGFREWFYNGTKPLSASSGARNMGLWLALAILPLTMLTGCSAITIKPALVAAHQAAEISFSAVDDGERVLCFGTKDISTIALDQRGHCTMGTPGLTDQLHQDLSRHLVAAFDAQTKVGPAIKAWKVGDQVPTSLVTLEAERDQIQALTKAFDPTLADAIGTWLTNVQKWSADVTALQQLLGGAK